MHIEDITFECPDMVTLAAMQWRPFIERYPDTGHVPHIVLAVTPSVAIQVRVSQDDKPLTLSPHEFLVFDASFASIHSASAFLTHYQLLAPKEYQPASESPTADHWRPAVVSGPAALRHYARNSDGWNGPGWICRLPNGRTFDMDDDAFPGNFSFTDTCDPATGAFTHEEDA